MIDLHAHVLPEIDDGSSGVAESLAMLRESRRQGVDTMVATPHFLADRERPDRFLARRNRAFSRLEPHLTAEMPTLLLGAEVTYFNGMDRSEEVRALCLGDSDLLLVEMPFSPWSSRMVDEVSALGQRLGVVPVLAHIERYLRQEGASGWLDAFADNGVYFQCNGSFFLSFWDRRKALAMLRRGEIHFLGSDCHNMKERAPNLAQARDVIRKKAGDAFLEEIDRRARRRLGLTRRTREGVSL